MEQTQNFNKFAIPVRMGIIIALFRIILSTIQYKFFTGSYGASTIFWLCGFIATTILLILTGKMQRKALGGYIDIKQAFQAVFIAAIIMCVATGLYDYVYMKWIDPDMLQKIKEASMGFMEKLGAPQDALDKMEAGLDESQTLNIGKQLMGILTQIVIYGIFSFICAAIVKKDRPQQTAA